MFIYFWNFVVMDGGMFEGYVVRYYWDMEVKVNIFIVEGRW